MLPRDRYLSRLQKSLARAPVTALLDPRQVGKTTLAQMLATYPVADRFDLESPRDLRRLENPEYVLGRLDGLVIIDEIQRSPEVFAVLRVLLDRPNNPARFLILGSVSPDIVRGVSQSLAGRVEFVELAGFDLQEVGIDSWERLWVRGGYGLGNRQFE